MIRGLVNERGLPTIELRVRDYVGNISRLTVVVDTGFTGFVALPSTTITRLGLHHWGYSRFAIADGSEAKLPVHVGTIIWEGKERLAFVVATNAGSLIGMSLVDGRRLTMDIVEGGDVCIERLP